MATVQAAPSDMARNLTVQYPGAIYHVMNRGDRRESIFNHDQDRLLFLHVNTRRHPPPASEQKG